MIIKRHHLLLILLLLTSRSVLSQISLRPQVGVNVPSLTSDDLEGKLGYQFGADLQIGEGLYIQPGINFQTNELTLKNVGDLNVSRINIPVVLGFELFEQYDAAFGLRGFVGANLGFHTHENIDEISTSDITGDNFQSGVFSGIVGTGLDLGLFFVDAAYQFGLSNFIEGAQIEDSKNHMFLLNAGLRIGF